MTEKLYCRDIIHLRFLSRPYMKEQLVRSTTLRVGTDDCYGWARERGGMSNWLRSSTGHIIKYGKNKSHKQVLFDVPDHLLELCDILDKKGVLLEMKSWVEDPHALSDWIEVMRWGRSFEVRKITPEESLAILQWSGFAVKSGGR